MSRLSKIEAIPAGSWTKWAVVGFWVVVLVVVYPPSAKLMGALARKPDPAPAELSQERTTAAAGAMA